MTKIDHHPTMEKIDTSHVKRVLNNAFDLRGRPLYARLEDMGRPTAQHRRLYELMQKRSFNTPSMRRRVRRLSDSTRAVRASRRSKIKRRNGPSRRALMLFERVWKNHENRKKFVRVTTKKSHRVPKGNTLKVNPPCSAEPLPNAEPSARFE